MVPHSNLFGCSAIGLSTSNREMVFANERHLDLIGRTRDQVIGHSWEEWLPSDDVAAAEQPFHDLICERKPYMIYTRLVRPDGKVGLVTARCSIIRGDTPDRDLVFSEMLPVDGNGGVPTAEQFEAAKMIRDLTYELAGLSGRHGLGLLTQALIDASATAEATVDQLARAIRDAKRADR